MLDIIIARFLNRGKRKMQQATTRPRLVLQPAMQLSVAQVCDANLQAGQLVYGFSGPVHCGKTMAMRQGRYVCVVCGASY